MVVKRPGPSENAILLKTVKEQGLLGGRHHLIVCRAGTVNERMDKLSGLLRADNVGHIITHMLREIELAKPFSACMSFFDHITGMEKMRGLQGVVHILDANDYSPEVFTSWCIVKDHHERYRK